MRRFLLVPLVLLLLPVATAASDGGPSPGTVLGSDGVLAPNGLVRYVALPAGQQTTVLAVRVHGGGVLRFGSVPGSYGIPLVTQNGEAGGLSRDGRTLVLATYTATGTTSTRFAILETQRLRVRRIVTLPGSFSYDALSPDAKTLYLIQYSHLATTSQRYRVRAYDLVAGRLLAGVIADKREAGLAMRGYPVARATTADGGWVYTLYGKSDGTAFVHALDAGHRAAICIDLPWRHVQTSIWRVKLALAGSQLVLSQPHGGKLAMIDTRSFAVRALRAPGA